MSTGGMAGLAEAQEAAEICGLGQAISMDCDVDRYWARHSELLGQLARCPEPHRLLVLIEVLLVRPTVGP